MAASELCLAQLDYSSYYVFNFPRLLFCRVYPGHQVKLSTSQRSVRYMGQKTDILQKGSLFFL